MSRGDMDAAWRWSLVFERQFDIALKLAGLDPDDRRLRRYQPALAALRQAVLAARKRPKPLPLNLPDFSRKPPSGTPD